MGGMPDNRVTEGFLSPDEFAHELGVKSESVRTWVRRGLLPCVQLGRLQLIPRDALDRLLRKGEWHSGQ